MKLLSIKEAADALGYSVKGLRKIIDRSRAQANGARTRGPTIKFFQSSPRAPIKFRPEWIEQFVNQCTIDPESGSAASRPVVRKGQRPDCELLEL